MNTNIQIFENSEFGQVRTMTNAEGEPLFCGKDVAEALGYNNPPKAIRDHVEEDDRTKRSLIDSLGREQQSFFINESGLYALILAEGVTERTVPLRQGDADAKGASVATTRTLVLQRSPRRGQ